MFKAYLTAFVLSLSFSTALNAKVIKHPIPEGQVDYKNFNAFNLIQSDLRDKGGPGFSLMLIFRFVEMDNVHIIPATHRIPKEELKDLDLSFLNNFNYISSWAYNRINKQGDKPLDMIAETDEFKVTLNPPISMFHEGKFDTKALLKDFAFPCSFEFKGKYEVSGHCKLNMLGKRGVIANISGDHPLRFESKQMTDVLDYQGKGERSAEVFQGSLVRVEQRRPHLSITKPKADGNLIRKKQVDGHTQLITNTKHTDNDYYVFDRYYKFPTPSNYDTQIIKKSCSNSPIIAMYQRQERLYKEDCTTGEFYFIKKDQPTRIAKLLLSDQLYTWEELSAGESEKDNLIWENTVYRTASPGVLAGQYHSDYFNVSPIHTGGSVRMAWYFRTEKKDGKQVKNGWGICGDSYPCIFLNEPYNFYDWQFNGVVGRNYKHSAMSIYGDYLQDIKNITRYDLTHQANKLGLLSITPYWDEFNTYFEQLKPLTAELEGLLKKRKDTEIKQKFSQMINIAEKANKLYQDRNARSTYEAFLKRAEPICRSELLTSMKQHDPQYRRDSDYIIRPHLSTGRDNSEKLTNKLICSVLPNPKKHKVCDLLANPYYAEECTSTFDYAALVTDNDFQDQYLDDAGGYRSMLLQLEFRHSCYKSNSVKHCMLNEGTSILLFSLHSRDKDYEKHLKKILVN
ncbi:hypothetical protein ACMXYQ_12605 [Neptuniibacter sp. PT34_22]|uniref:hypothetical protein n=1 Tax=Neptuniibacter sp. PT34_22 TaxID=3398205 RepID=UPI0039F47FE1